MLRTTCYHLYIIDTYFFIKWTKSEQLSLVANAPTTFAISYVARTRNGGLEPFLFSLCYVNDVAVTYGKRISYCFY